MSFFLFRIFVLAWNNMPEFGRRILLATHLPQLVASVWTPYRDLYIPPTEHPVQNLISKLVQPGDTCADIGANYGMMTDVMAAKVGSTGRVYAFEAHPFNAKILARRMKLKGFDQIVTVENKAVSDGKQKSVLLFAGRRSSPNEWNIVGHDVEGHSTKAAMEIPAIALDEYFTPQKRIHLLKVDVEGAEVNVLNGAQRLLADSKPAVIIEFHGVEAWQQRQALFPAGYTFYTLEGKEVGTDGSYQYHVCVLPPGQNFPKKD